MSDLHKLLGGTGFTFRRKQSIARARLKQWTINHSFEELECNEEIYDERLFDGYETLEDLCAALYEETVGDDEGFDYYWDRYDEWYDRDYDDHDNYWDDWDEDVQEISGYWSRRHAISDWNRGISQPEFMTKEAELNAMCIMEYHAEHYWVCSWDVEEEIEDHEWYSWDCRPATYPSLSEHHNRKRAA